MPFIFNQIFLQKTLVIYMIKRRWVVGRQLSFPEHISATVRNSLILVRILEQVAAGVFIFILCPLIHIFTSFTFPEHNSATVKNILRYLETK